MAALPVVLNVSHFYGEVLKVPLGIMGLIFIAARVIDAIQDPVIGLISDKFTHRGPRGRLTFVALMLPLMIGGFYMLFHPPEALFTNSTLLALWLFVALFVVHLGYAGVSISYHAHGAELTDDYNERTRVTVGREVFGLMGMTLAVVLPTIFTARARRACRLRLHGPDLHPDRAGLRPADAALVAALGASAGRAREPGDPCPLFPRLAGEPGACAGAADAQHGKRAPRSRPWCRSSRR